MRSITNLFWPCICCQDVLRYKVGDPKTFHYLNQSNCIQLDAINDAKEYIDLRRAMDIVGISAEEQVLAVNFIQNEKHSLLLYLSICVYSCLRIGWNISCRCCGSSPRKR